MTPYHRLLDEHVAGRSVSEVAREWGVPNWVIFDGLSESAKVPSMKYAPRIARGMGMTIGELFEKVAPPEEGDATSVPRPNGRKRGMPIAST